MDIRIIAYEDRMKPQVAEMFSVQYNVPVEDFSLLMDNFYDHPYQKEKCIRIAAMDGEKVVGFQSFFYWPYFYNGKEFHSFQSGNSLVNPAYRGKGIFQQLLNYLGEHREKLGIDFLIGFPISASRNSLIRNGWKNILDLEWYIAPTGFLFSLFGDEKKKLARTFSNQSGLSIKENGTEFFRLSDEKEFLEWRKSYSSNQNYFYHVYRENEKSAEFTLKPSRRKKIIRELIIGDVRTDSADPGFIERAFLNLRATVKKSGAAGFLSFACNSQAAYISGEILSSASFRKIDKKIFFAVKPFTDEQLVEDATKWILFRSDIDTW